MLREIQTILGIKPPRWRVWEMKFYGAYPTNPPLSFVFDRVCLLFEWENGEMEWIERYEVRMSDIARLSQRVQNTNGEYKPGYYMDCRWHDCAPLAM